MPEPAEIRQRLEERVAAESLAVTRCLVAAERAVEEGQFGCAKVLRVAAHAARRRALHLQRLLATHTAPTGGDVAEASAAVRAERLRRQSHPELAAYLEADRALCTLLDRAVASLEQHRDIVESDVALVLHGCAECGWIVENQAPEHCPHCGTLGAEFVVFAPFYVATPDRLGRRRPQEILDLLAESPRALSAVLTGVDEPVRRHSPSPDAWSMKEIAGHLIDITELFASGLRGGPDPETKLAPPPKNQPPWKILEGMDYQNVPVALLLSEFARLTNDVLAHLKTFTDTDWVRPGEPGGRHGNFLDKGTWLVNHNIAHLKQLEALRTKGHR